MSQTKSRTTAVEPNTRRWDELVALGIAKDADRNWSLGDIALEIAPMGENSAHNGSQRNLGLYAGLIGVEIHSLMVYRDVAAAWPPPTRVGGAAWKVHSMFMAESKKPILLKAAAKLGPDERITVTRAHELLKQSTAGRSGPRTTKQKAAEVARLITDQALGDVLADDPSLLRSIPNAVIEELRNDPQNEQVQAKVSYHLTSEINHRAKNAAEAQRKLAEDEKRRLAEAEAAKQKGSTVDAEAEARRKGFEQYMRLVGQLQEVQSHLGAVDGGLEKQGFLGTEEHRLALLQLTDEIRTQVDIIALKLGKNISTADL